MPFTSLACCHHCYKNCPLQTDPDTVGFGSVVLSTPCKRYVGGLVYDLGLLLFPCALRTRSILRRGIVRITRLGKMVALSFNVCFQDMSIRVKAIKAHRLL